MCGEESGEEFSARCQQQQPQQQQRRPHRFVVSHLSARRIALQRVSASVCVCVQVFDCVVRNYSCMCVCV